MALTDVQLTDEVAVVMGTGARTGDNLRTSILRWINQACRKIAYAYPWDERRAEQRVATIAPYTTGTATFTNASVTVTGSGTTWSAAFVGRKIALSQGAPPYRIATRVSNTEITIADAYIDDTATGTTYVVYQDEYDLAATTHSVEDIVPLDGVSSVALLPYEQKEIDAYDISGRTTGRPVAYGVCTSTTAGTPRIRFLPVPDNEYRESVRYLKTFTDLTGAGDLYTTSLPVDVEELIIDRALRWAPKLEGSRRVMTDKEWSGALNKVYQAHNKRRYRFGQRRGFRTYIGPRIVFGSGGLV